ncbi:MAG TPA: lipid-binding SYLF domain-containing protein [Terriglobia bacterium]|nr:lipid-binding SYLF domain-containing protein [Terriglobia bacterium]
MRLTAGLLILVMVAPLLAGDAEQERLDSSAEALEEIMNIPDALPQELIHKAECVAIMPSVKKFALGFGGSYGKGALVCRSGANFTGAWGAPAMYRLEGASIGFQLGGQAADYVLLVMNPKGVESLLKSKVKLGADAAVAAGPKGRNAMAATDAYMRAEILTYSRSRGLFAGVSLEGSTLRQDNGANEKLYGQKDVSAKDIIMGGKGGGGHRISGLLQKASPTNQSDPASIRK